MRSFKSVALLCLLVMVAGASQAQQSPPASPKGHAATQVGGEYEGRRYSGGKWIQVDYSRPILRGRTGIFGSGESYGQTVNAGAPVWRAGANQSTRLKTDVDLSLGGKTLPAGEYSLFVELKESGWTLIVSNHDAKQNPRDREEPGIWGSYGYSKDKDVVRVPMEVHETDLSCDEFTIVFLNMTSGGGNLAMWWEKTIAVAPFTVAD